MTPDELRVEFLERLTEMESQLVGKIEDSASKVAAHARGNYTQAVENLKQDHERRIGRLDHAIHGNGQPGLSQRVTSHGTVLERLEPAVTQLRDSVNRLTAEISAKYPGPEAKTLWTPELVRAIVVAVIVALTGGAGTLALQNQQAPAPPAPAAPAAP